MSYLYMSYFVRYKTNLVNFVGLVFHSIDDYEA